MDFDLNFDDLFENEINTDTEINNTEINNTEINNTEINNTEKTKTINENSCIKSQKFPKWIPLDTIWENILLSNKFIKIDALGDGNCQFNSIEIALSNCSKNKFTQQKIRNIIAKYIKEMSQVEFNEILNNYKIEKQNGEFRGNWDPFKIKNKQNFIKELKTSGFNFEGDNVTLALLSKAISIDFLIFTSDYNIISLINPDNLQNKLIILYYDTSLKHYSTIALKEKKILTCFDTKNLPKEIKILLDRNLYYLEHLRKICTVDNCKQLTLNSILTKIESSISPNTKLSKYTKRSIINIIKNWIINENFFNEK